MSCLLHEFIAMNRPDRRIPERWTEAEDRILFDEVQSQCKHYLSQLPSHLHHQHNTIINVTVAITIAITVTLIITTTTHRQPTNKETKGRGKEKKGNITLETRMRENGEYTVEANILLQRLRIQVTSKGTRYD